ncbi:MAG: Omp28-related outer membrane protein [Saprospiraceae bacterium]|nr:Omp28-related outer membrane protein [Saprospiraceae bacterium]
MIRNLLIVFYLLIFVAGLWAQTPRKALVEHFTQASCPPCAYYNPLIKPVLDRNDDKVCRISYQVSWPGFDPMNKDNPGEVQTRVSYYGVTGVPDSYLNAVSSGPPTTTLTDETIRNATLVPAPFSIALENTLLEDYRSMEVRVTVTRTADYTGTPNLRVAVLEKIIEWSSPPGSNGETEFHHVFKKFLPNATGTKLAELTANGKSQSFVFVFPFDKLYDFRNLETVAFIQDDATHQVYQAENAYLNITQRPGLDVALMQLSAAGTLGDSLLCGKNAYPVVQIINGGNTEVSALEFNYSIDQGAVQSHTWNGRLAYLEKVEIALPAIGFAPSKAGNLLNLTIDKVNGSADVFPSNNSSHIPFYQTPTTTNTSAFEFKPAAQPGQISFRIYDEQNQIILADGPFADNTTKKYPLTLESEKCYDVVVSNGTTSLNGTYKVFNDQNALIFQQRVIGTGVFTRRFGTHTLVRDNTLSSDAFAFSIFPNPSSGQAVLVFPDFMPNEGRIECRAMDGSLVWRSAIQREVLLPVAGLARGLYLVSVLHRGGKQTRKLVVN